MLLDGKLIINESTVAPGTTREEFGSLGGKYFLACSPERVDPGNKDKTVRTISKVVGGVNPESLALAKVLYEKVLDAPVVSVSSLEAAEMVKMLENTYRAVNIALVNEFARLSEKTGLDVVEIIEAAKTKWSYHAHYPSVGVGGHCIPVDPWYLVDFSKKKNVNLTLIEQSLKENDAMAQVVADKVISQYKKGATVLLYGLTYKKDVKDIRESPVIRLARILQKNNIRFVAYDPLLNEQEIKAFGFTPGKLKTSDIFIVGTDHKQLSGDFKRCVDNNTIIIDGRNFFRIKVGKSVLGVGRSLV
ncbi:MAG: nucleotide sugar dehydrogenase [uncultured bacterium]|nr:MAG: nucleotide sugar dehydrogenase [uncultured bacterium]